MTRRHLSLLLPALALAVIATSCSSLSVAAATVNGEKITESAVESELDTLREDPIFGEALRRDPDTRGQRRREILAELIYQEIARQEAEKLDIEVTDEQVENLIARSARSAGLSVKEFLAEERLTQEDADRLAERGVRRFALIDEVVEDVDVPRSTVREVYEAQQDRFVEVHLERITVKDEAAARDVLERLEGADSFGDIARDVSTDDKAKAGGDLGFQPLTSLDVQVQGALGEVVEGGLTDPIPTEDGVELYRLVERKTKSFEEAEPEIRQSLTQEERDRRFDEWLVGKVRASEIVVNPKYGRFDKQAARPTVIPSSSELRP